MDDALVPGIKKVRVEDPKVLILVLMDDALVQSGIRWSARIMARLNPCFNG